MDPSSIQFDPPVELSEGDRLHATVILTLLEDGTRQFKLGEHRVDRASDAVNHPKHYGGEDNPYEVIKVLEAWDITDPYIWNAIKYLARAGKKGDRMEDLKKAQFYLNREISNGSK